MSPRRGKRVTTHRRGLLLDKATSPKRGGMGRVLSLCVERGREIPAYTVKKFVLAVFFVHIIVWIFAVFAFLTHAYTLYFFSQKSRNSVPTQKGRRRWWWSRGGGSPREGTPCVSSPLPWSRARNAPFPSQGRVFCKYKTLGVTYYHHVYFILFTFFPSHRHSLFFLSFFL